jgi:hypothetical protein
MTHRRWLVALAVLAVSGMTLSAVWAQGAPSPAPYTSPGAAPATPPGAPDIAVGGGWGATVFVLAVLAMIVIMAAIAKYHDLRNRRETAALALQSRLSDALLTDQALDGLAVTPSVHVPMSGSPAIVEITGEVPSPDAREQVLRAVSREAQAVRADVEIEDRMLVLPPVRARAA